MTIALITLFCVLIHPVLSSPTSNITIPDGTNDHGDPNLICTPTQWTTIVAFFIGNYLTHVATTVSYPGETWMDHGLACILALLFPMVGAGRGLIAIIRFANRDLFSDSLGSAFRKKDQYSNPEMERNLKKAARAGALCMVTRIPEGLVLDSESNTPLEAYVVRKWIRLVIPVVRQVQGIPDRLPPGYCFTFVPSDAEVVCPKGEGFLITPLTSSYGDAIKGGIAILQLTYASLTLYRARGDQISRYGFAAFAFTVIPYAVMSFVNLIGNLATPSYSSMYLVHSKEMDEAKEKEPFQSIEVGKLVYEDGEQGLTFKRTVTKERSRQILVTAVVAILTVVIWLFPFVVIGALSRFSPGGSSSSQQGWTMGWLLVSVVGPSIYVIWHSRATEHWRQRGIFDRIGLVVSWIAYVTPAIGGFVTVAKMLIQYGDCIRFK